MCHSYVSLVVYVIVFRFCKYSSNAPASIASVSEKLFAEVAMLTKLFYAAEAVTFVVGDRHFFRL